MSNKTKLLFVLKIQEHRTTQPSDHYMTQHFQKYLPHVHGYIPGCRKKCVLQITTLEYTVSDKVVWYFPVVGT